MLKVSLWLFLWRRGWEAEDQPRGGVSLPSQRWLWPRPGWWQYRSREVFPLLHLQITGLFQALILPHFDLCKSPPGAHLRVYMLLICSPHCLSNKFAPLLLRDSNGPTRIHLCCLIKLLKKRWRICHNDPGVVSSTPDPVPPDIQSHDLYTFNQFSKRCKETTLLSSLSPPETQA